MEPLPTQAYEEQVKRWPKDGRHILAHFDDASIVVYQAYRPSIAQYALEHARFGGPEFSFSRMSWIKPNFLWMMYRSTWGTAEGQEAILGVRLSRAFFDRVLATAVVSTYSSDKYATRAAWQAALASSNVRLQWDPDHGPGGEKLERRAIQLGLRGDILKAYASSEVLEIIDITSFVAAQRPHSKRDLRHRLQTPLERVYEPADAAAAASVGLDGLPVDAHSGRGGG